MIFVKLISVFWLSISSMFSLGSKESSNYIESHEIVNQDAIIKNVVLRDNTIVIGAGERSSLDGLYSVQYWARNVEPYYADWANANGNVTMYRNLLQDVPYGVTNNMDNVIYISQIGSSGEPTTIFNARRIRFRSYVVNAQNFRRWYYYIGLGNDGNNEEYGIEWNVFTDITGTTQFENKTPLLFNCNFMHVQDYNIWNPVSVTYLEETDYAMSFKINSTLYNMYYSYLTDDKDASYNNGFANGAAAGYNSGYNEGYEEGYTEGSAGSPEITSIFTGILDVGLLPVNVFLALFNFELFGVNVSGLITGMLTIGMIMILLRFIFGGKSNDK